MVHFKLFEVTTDNLNGTVTVQLPVKYTRASLIFQKLFRYGESNPELPRERR